MAKTWVVHQNAGLAALKNTKALDPTKLGPELQKYETNEAALNAAQNPKNPLHRHLEWDNAAAGAAYRLGQIAALRSCIRLYDDETDEVTKAYIGLRDEGKKRQVRYYSPEKVIDSVALQRRLIEMAIRKLDAFSQDFRELMDLCEGVKATRDRLIGELDRLGRGASA